MCFGCLMGFIIHFYINFGTNLLPEAQSKLLFFCLFQCFAEKEYQTESKWNETFGNVIFETNVSERTWSGRQESPRGRGAYSPGRALPLVAQPTYFFLLYILIYPENIQEHHETLFPPPQPSVPVRSHLGALSGAPL